MISAVIFDLDGVIVSTDEYHYQAWKKLADHLGIPFTRHDNEALRGVSRAESLEIVLSRSPRRFTDEEKQEFMELKNDYYRASLQDLSPADILPGVADLLAELERRKVVTAIGSSSKNAPLILAKIGYATKFAAVADGNDIQRSKPDPEVFLLAAQRLGKKLSECLVVEDAEAGVEAALRAGMKVLGVGSASSDTRVDFASRSLTGIDLASMIL